MCDDQTAERPRRSVLVVEDDPAIGKMLVTLLSAEGYAPRLVTDGGAVLDAARASRPDIITLDLSLPTVDGIQILEQLDGVVGPRIPVVVVSAYTAQLTADHRQRVSAVLTKPFDIDALLACIIVALGRA
ncbi:MAG: response regulator transcription factor [Chloroflexi bacterium]|nr:response regulator transcription factor [Chloroflexota bacterium]